MSEADVVEQLVEFTNILLVGVSLIFSIVSAYVVALNYFIGSANFLARLGSFAFVTLILGMLMFVLIGAEVTHSGLMARLAELEAQNQISAVGRAVLTNARPGMTGAVTGNHYSINDVVRFCVRGGLLFVYIALGYLTFFHRWTPDAIPVSIQQRAPQ